MTSWDASVLTQRRVNLYSFIQGRAKERDLIERVDSEQDDIPIVRCKIKMGYHLTSKTTGTAASFSGVGVVIFLFARHGLAITRQLRQLVVEPVLSRILKVQADVASFDFSMINQARHDEDCQI